MTVRRIRLRIGADKKAPGAARTKLGNLKVILGERFDDAALVVSELVSNAVRHSGSDGDLEVQVEVTESEASIVVTDAGGGIDPHSESENGRGLEIVDKLAKEWGYSSSPSTVWVKLDLAGDNPGDA